VFILSTVGTTRSGILCGWKPTSWILPCGIQNSEHVGLFYVAVVDEEVLVC
jgi:hypothetical protein